MDSIHRLNINPSLQRETPKNEFGDVLARGIGTAGSVVGGMAAPFLPGSAVLSAAVNSTQTALSMDASPKAAMGSGAVAQGATAVRAGAAAVGGAASTAPAAGGGAAPGGSGASDGLEGQRQLMQANQQWTQQYLALQNDMQRESREYNALTNIMKVRHESAKTAINNIR